MRIFLASLFLPLSAWAACPQTFVDADDQVLLTQVLPAPPTWTLDPYIRLFNLRFFPEKSHGIQAASCVSIAKNLQRSTDRPAIINGESVLYGVQEDVSIYLCPSGKTVEAFCREAGEPQDSKVLVTIARNFRPENRYRKLSEPPACPPNLEQDQAIVEMSTVNVGF